LFNEATKYRLTGDEELSYINYMKYLTIVTMVQGLEEYKKEKAFFNQLLGPQNVSLALDMAEKLSGSLQQR
jgi:putative effector of murein hydrolase